MPCHFLLLYNINQEQKDLEILFDTLYKELQTIHEYEYFSVQILNDIQATLVQNERESFSVYHENYLTSLDENEEVSKSIDNSFRYNYVGSKILSSRTILSSQDEFSLSPDLRMKSHLLRGSFRVMFDYLEGQLSNKTHVNIFIIMSQEYASGFGLNSSFHDLLPFLKQKMYIITPSNVKLSESFWRPYSILLNSDILEGKKPKDIELFVKERFAAIQPCYIAYGHLLHPISLHRDPVLCNLGNIVPRILSIQSFISLNLVQAISSIAKFTINPLNEDTIDEMHDDSFEVYTSQQQQQSFNQSLNSNPNSYFNTNLSQFFNQSIHTQLNKSPYIIEAYGCSYRSPRESLIKENSLEGNENNFFEFLSKLILDHNIAPIVALNEGRIAVILPAIKKNKFELTLNCIDESAQLHNSSNQYNHQNYVAQRPFDDTVAPWLHKPLTQLHEESIARMFQFSPEDKKIPLIESSLTTDDSNILNQDERTVKQCFEKMKRLLHAGNSKWQMFLKECERIRKTCILYKNRAMFQSLIQTLKQENILIKSSNIDDLIQTLLKQPQTSLISTTNE